LSRTVPELSVGLHVDLGKNIEECAGSPGRVRDELGEQFRLFEELMGGPPTHLDSHHNVHRDPRVLPAFLDLAQEHELPLREHSPVRYFSGFYGQWRGQTHLEHISAENLAQMLRTQIGEGITELSCHPGYVDADYPGSYGIERETELRALCHRLVRQTAAKEAIELISYHELASLVTR
jgi:predicted glycoside hydrolase/deacetylase ChbG (UPF0249 family)